MPRSLLLVPVLAAMLIGAASRPARAASTPFADACATLDDGQQVRAQTLDGATLEAPFAGCRDDAMLLLTDDGLRAIPYADLAALWSRERHVGRGAKTGAIIGSIGGAGFFYLMALLIEAIGEGEDDVDKVPVVLLGAGLGAGAGAASGAIVGAAVPRWRLVHAREGVALADDGAAEVVRTRVEGRIGSVGLSAGLGWPEGAEADAAGVGGTLTLTADYPSGLSFGPEFGTFDAGEQDPGYELEEGFYYRFAERVWFLGGLVRYAFGSGRLRPYVVVGMAGYRWEDSFLGASFGAGVALPLRDRRLTGRVEYRRHDNIQNLSYSDPGFGVVTAGLNLGW